ncbi:MAG: hypothetical protein ACXWMJ_03520 [Syntrophales bacterium]
MDDFETHEEFLLRAAIARSTITSGLLRQDIAVVRNKKYPYEYDQFTTPLTDLVFEQWNLIAIVSSTGKVSLV